LVIALFVIVRDVFVEEAPQVALAERDHSIEAFSACRSDEALRMGVQVRTPSGQTHELGARSIEDVAKTSGEQRVPVADQVPYVEEGPIDDVNGSTGDVAHPFIVRRGADAEYVDAASGEPDGEVLRAELPSYERTILMS
jgi:hypothetical protein